MQLLCKNKTNDLKFDKYAIETSWVNLFTITKATIQENDSPLGPYLALLKHTHLSRSRIALTLFQRDNFRKCRYVNGICSVKR